MNVAIKFLPPNGRLTGAFIRFRVSPRLSWGAYMPDELKIVLEDVQGKFDTVIESFNVVRGSLDRFRDENRQGHEELRKDIVGLQADMVTVKKDLKDLKSDTTSIRQNLNDHRTKSEFFISSPLFSGFARSLTTFPRNVWHALPPEPPPAPLNSATH